MNHKYGIYCRKSTDESSGKQNQSIEQQETVLRELAHEMKLDVVEIYRETQSAKTPGRPVFNQMLKDIHKGKINAILCREPNRLSRNWEESGKVQQLLVDGHIKEIRCLNRVFDQSTHNIISAIEVAESIQYSINLSTMVTNGMEHKASKGIKPGKAPVGYLNYQETPENRYIITDQFKAPIIREMFGLCATGQYTMPQLATIAYNKGLATLKSKKKLTSQQIKDILTNPYYYGVLKYKEEYFQGTHESIISKDIFDQVQQVLGGKSKPCQQKRFFPYRGLLTCDECDCMVTVERQKIYDYHHCTDGKKIGCKQKSYNINGTYIDQYIADILQKIDFDEELVEIMYQASLKDLQRETKQSEASTQHFETQIARLENQKAKLLDLRMADEIDADEYQTRKQSITKDIADQQVLLKKAQNQPDPRITLELTKKVFLDSNSLKNEFMNATPERKREIAFELLSNSRVRDRKIISTQYKSPYNVLVGTPVNGDLTLMWTCGDSNSVPLACHANALPDELQAQYSVPITYSDRCTLFIL